MSLYSVEDLGCPKMGAQRCGGLLPLSELAGEVEIKGETRRARGGLVESGRLRMQTCGTPGPSDFS